MSTTLYRDLKRFRLNLIRSKLLYWQEASAEGGEVKTEEGEGWGAGKKH